MLTTERGRASATCFPVAWSGLPQAVGPNDVIYLADGSIRLRVRETNGDEVLTQGRDGRHGHLAPGAQPARRRSGAVGAGPGRLRLDRLRCEQGVDLIAVSFVRGREPTSTPVNARLAERGADIPVIAKIEKREAVGGRRGDRAAATGGIMVARGDLGIELPIETVPPFRSGCSRLAGPPREAVDHGDPDARLDGALHPPDACRGDRRGERDLRRHRRGDALRGDRGRPATRSRPCR